MKLTLLERLALLEAEVQELRAANPESGTGHVKEVLFYSTLQPGDQVLVDDAWKTVQSIHDGNPNDMVIMFSDGVRTSWKKDKTILRRALRERLPERPNRVSREAAKRGVRSR